MPTVSQYDSMMRIVFGLLVMTLLGRKGRPMQTSEMLTPEKAEFIERKAEETYRYVLDSYDTAKAEGKNVLQWLFAAVIGGLGLGGTLVQNGYLSVAFGALLASVWAALSVCRLIRCLESQDILPPGNLAESLNTMLSEPVYRMRWREANGLDDRNRENLEHVKNVCIGVDRARNAISWIPAWFVAGTAAAALFRSSADWFPCIKPLSDWLRQVPL